MRLATVAVLGLAGAMAIGCQYPRDPEGTLDRVSGGTMRVGVIDHPPWAAWNGGKPRGVEPRLIREFARELDSEIEWFDGTEEELVEALRGFQLDVVIGGLTRASPAAMHAGLTRPYIDTEIQYAVRPGESLPDDLDGVRVWVEEGSEAAALMRQEEDGAIPVYVDDVSQVKSPALLDTYDIEALGFERTDNIKRDDEHAMAVPMGENAFLVELDNFLLDRGAEAEEILAEEAAR
jgi:polar amino acid transport system substrate-binding protein